MREACAVIGFAACAATLMACTASPDPCETGEPGTVCRIAGTGEPSFNGDGRDALDTGLYHPTQVRRGPDGLLYVMDFNNMRLRRIEQDGTVSTVAGSGIHAGASVGDIAYESSLENPIDFDFLPDGRIVFVSYHDPRVLVIDFDGRLQAIAGSLPGTSGSEGDGGLAKDARFIELAGIAVTADGTIYVSDSKAARIRRIRNGMISTYAGFGVPGYTGDGGPADQARLSDPSALTFDLGGNLLVSDTGNCAIRKIALDGTISTFAGIGYPGFGGDGGPASKAMLAHPEGIAVAADGTMFIGDRFNNRVRRVSVDGTIDTIAGTGDGGLSGDGGPALDATFGKLARVSVDTDGSLLIADQTNSTIRRLVTE